MNIPQIKKFRRLFYLLTFFLLFSTFECSALGTQHENERIKSIRDLTKMDIISLIVVGCFASIAVSAGGGGGVVSMPIFLGLMRVPFSQATTFSSAIILGGVICALVANLLQNKRTLPEYSDAIDFLQLVVTENQINDYTYSFIPVDKAPLIDIQIVLFIAPLLTLGSLCGVFIGRYISNIVSILVLNVLLMYVLKVSITKFNKIRESEKRSKHATNDRSELLSSPLQTSKPISIEKVKENLKVILYLYTISVVGAEPNEITNTNERGNCVQINQSKFQNKWFKLGNYKLWASFIVLCFFSVWMSILDCGSFITRGTLIHSLLWISSILILLFFPAVALTKGTLNLIASIINSHERFLNITRNVRLNGSAKEYEVVDIASYIKSRSCSNLLNYILASLEMLLVGIVGGITGASGGILISAIFYSSQIDPSSIAANNSTCLIISTLTCFCTYLFEGRVHIDLAILLLIISIVCTLIGKNVVDYYVRKYKLSSLIVGILIFLISASLIYMNLRLFALILYSNI
ncbi:membrane associated protein [Cryptosporidium canis]|uniref:Membrane associated protein n=1 Tax=Cryptosporidium canis TaxID=195482 RepID=A0ABQ8P7M7_9CRYT|nr:membrane associated protein [Cryptosporidium canis]KAJ1611739.1 membrane associated protein [Cryptosporidium canis]